MPNTLAKYNVPNHAQITNLVYSLWMYSHSHWDVSECGEGLDIRLVVGREGTRHFGDWATFEGLSDYDTWHGYCESATIPVTEAPSREESNLIALSLVSGVIAQLPI